MKYVRVLVVLIFSFSTLVQCTNNKETKDQQRADEHYILEIPSGFPEPELPDDNPLTLKKIELGKKLFFDPILSLDSSISCGSCHFQKFAFSDTVAISKGVHGTNGMRNAPPLFNLAWQTDFFHDAGVPTLELQVLAPIQTKEEMDLNILEVVKRLNQDQEYINLSQEAFSRDPDPYVITRAIACFERTLISGNSRYDQYTYQNDHSVLTAEEKNGMKLFFGSKFNCSSCHSGFNFTNFKVVSNGLYESYTNDAGRMRITLAKEDEGLYKVPSLRNIELTAPYMHDGSMNDLNEVIEHYASGGSNHFNKSELITGFDITETEKKELIAFLMTLTDKEFIENIAYNE